MADKHKAFVKTTEHLVMQAAMTNSQGGTTQEEWLKKCNQLMLLGNPRATVRYLTDRDGGGILEPHTSSGKEDQRWKEFLNLSILKEENPEEKMPYTTMTIYRRSQTSAG
jgi:hypothetical protein